MRILVLHGVNLNMFGKRDPSQYGTATLADIDAALQNLAADLDVTVACFQTNHEGAMVERIHQALGEGVNAVVINAGAWTHYSYALADALEKISAYARGIPMATAEAHPETAQMMIMNPLSGGGLAGLFSTHPATAERVARLRRPADQRQR